MPVDITNLHITTTVIGEPIRRVAVHVFPRVRRGSNGAKQKRRVRRTIAPLLLVLVLVLVLACELGVVLVRVLLLVLMLAAILVLASARVRVIVLVPELVLVSTCFLWFRLGSVVSIVFLWFRLGFLRPEGAENQMKPNKTR